MTDFQSQVYFMMCAANRCAEAEAYKKKCESEDQGKHSMTELDARKYAETQVFCHFGRSDIERECRARGIPMVKNRGKMELALIEVLTKEYTKCREEGKIDKMS